MWRYWLLFAFFAVGALMQGTPQVAGQPDGEGRLTGQRPASAPMLIVRGLLIAAMVGLRYKVGADWKTSYFYCEYAGPPDSQRDEPAPARISCFASPSCVR